MSYGPIIGARGPGDGGYRPVWQESGANGILRFGIPCGRTIGSIDEEDAPAPRPAALLVDGMPPFTKKSINKHVKACQGNAFKPKPTK